MHMHACHILLLLHNPKTEVMYLDSSYTSVVATIGIFIGGPGDIISGCLLMSGGGFYEGFHY